MNMTKALLLPLLLLSHLAHSAETATPIQQPEGRSGSFVIHGEFDPAETPHNGKIATRIHGTITVGAEKTTGNWKVTLEPIATPLTLVYLQLKNTESIREVRGADLRGWGLQQKEDGATLGLAFSPSQTPEGRTIEILTSHEQSLPWESAKFLQISPLFEGLSRASVEFHTPPGIGLQFQAGNNVRSLENPTVHYASFALDGFPYELSASARQVPINPFTIENYTLRTEFTPSGPRHLWSGTITVHSDDGVELPLLRGAIALSEAPDTDDYTIQASPGNVRLKFPRAGSYAVELPFTVKVQESVDGGSLAFTPAEGTVRHFEAVNQSDERLVLTVAGVTRLLTESESTESFPLDREGTVRMNWTRGAGNTSAKKFFTVDGATTITVAKGALEQDTRFAYSLTQGAMQDVRLNVDGPADILDLTGPSIRDWSVRDTGDGTREILVQFSEAQSGQFLLRAKMMEILSAFPVEVEPTRLSPVGAQRFSGFLRIDFDAETKIDIAGTNGLLQVAPNLFPSARFDFSNSPGNRPAIAFRHGSADYSLSLRAEAVTPELFQSVVILYETDFSGIHLSADFDVEIREAAVSTIPIEIPEDFMVLSVSGGDVKDYQLIEENGKNLIQIYLNGEIKGRTAFGIEMERPGSFEPRPLAVHPVTIPDANLVRGFVGLGTVEGIRIQIDQTENLTEIASAFLPRFQDRASFAWRMQQEDWTLSASLSAVEQSIRLDTFRLLTLAEETLYGSAIFNFAVTGAPLTELQFELPAGYDNPDFQGEGLRSWTLKDRTATLRFQSPLSGAFTILATYESPITRDTLFPTTGPTPLLKADEQGFLAFVSHFPFEIARQEKSGTLTRIEARDLPEEWRLLYSSPLIAAFRYENENPELSVALRSLPGIESIQQNIESLQAQTRINPNGELITELDLTLRSIQRPYLALETPEGSRIWETRVAGQAVTPVTDGSRTLIPLPATTGPDGTLLVSLTTANPGDPSSKMQISLPVFPAPVQDFTWTVRADGSVVPAFQDGLLDPINLPQPLSLQGFVFAIGLLLFGIGIMGMVLLVRLAIRVPFWWKRFLIGIAICTCAFIAFLGAILALETNLVQGHPTPLPEQLEFSGKVLPAAESIHATVVLTEPDGSRGFHPSIPWLVAGVVLLAGAFALRRNRPAALALSSAGLALIFFASATSFPASWPLLWIGVIAVVAQILVAGRFRWAGRGKASVLLALIALGVGNPPDLSAAQAESITHDLTLQANRLSGETRIEWKATTGETLALAPAGTRVTAIDYEADAIELVRTTEGALLARAKSDGTHSIRMEALWEPQVDGNSRTVTLAVGPALIQKAILHGKQLERITLESKEAVDIRESDDGQSLELSFRVGTLPDLSWAPAKRDPAKEPLRFFSESKHVYVPISGVVIGEHRFNLSFAQGQSSAFSINIPESQIVTHVEANRGHTWQFNPETGMLQILTSEPVSAPFTIRVVTEMVKSNLPYETILEIPRVADVESSLGSVLLATPSEVEVTGVTPTAMSPGGNDSAIDPSLVQIVGETLSVRERFRFGKDEPSLTFTARGVETEIHIESRQNLSLGEDRTLLSFQGTATVEKAGLFSMRFAVPAPFDVENISATNLAYWTKDATEDGLEIILHFQQKVLGKLQLALTFSGPGADRLKDGPLPAIRFDRVARESGLYQISPELGLKVTVDLQSAALQVDPQSQGIRKPGGHLIRLLSKDWQASYSIEKLSPWIETQSLARVTVDSSRVEHRTVFALDIENAGVKELLLTVPKDHSSLVVEHPHLSHFRQESPDDPSIWKVVFDRRIIGTSSLTVHYFTEAVPENEDWALDLPYLQNSDRSTAYASVFTNPRLDLTPDPSAENNRALWTNIPERLRGRTQAPASGLVFRLTEPGQPIHFTVRNLGESESLLKARVLAVNARSILAETGITLTETVVRLQTQSQRYLPIRIQEETTLWSAFVNGQNVRLWEDGDEILIPLAKSSVPGAETEVRLITATRDHPLSRTSTETQNLSLPDLGLPLENIEWLVHAPQEWRVPMDTLETTLNLAGIVTQHPDHPGVMPNQTITDNNIDSARELYGLGNSLLQQGKTQDANRAFESAYNLSLNDASFNADALVQWNEVRKQQALSGLNQRRSKVANVSGNVNAMAQMENQSGAIPVQSAQSAEGLAAVVQQLIEQQNAALPSPAQFDLTVPAATQFIRLQRVVAVDPWAELYVSFQTEPTRQPADEGSWWIALVAFILLGALGCGISRKKE
ncbi:MFS transporter [Puniceicoccus vermicola]|uniref:Uncharacterized protein n=1 Tax=Puniceicoccus vermicola TaxID=388746 RepID=A0A7X1AWC1_9BACT|nr:MFS transporter [Puniceicoccus vermicola]MBC2601171.1 hypothetical protein [Puniceicoccus vermicola]